MSSLLFIAEGVHGDLARSVIADEYDALRQHLARHDFYAEPTITVAVYADHIEWCVDDAEYITRPDAHGDPCVRDWQESVWRAIDGEMEALYQALVARLENEKRRLGIVA